MKKLYVFYINKKPSLDFLNSIRSTLYISSVSKETEDVFKVNFKSKFKTEIETIQIILVDLFESDNLINLLKNKIRSFFQQAHDLSEQNMDDITDESVENVFSTICSCLYKYSHMPNSDIFDFVADIFFKINVTHKLGNGNKRLATELLVGLLYTFGYYMKFSSDVQMNYEFYEGHCIECIHLNDEKIPENEIIPKIKEWIIRNILLSANIHK